MNKLVRMAGPYLLLLVLFCLPPVSSAGSFEEQISVDGQTLNLNGSGPRKKAFITIYDAALYLSESESDGKAILMSDYPMAISIVIRSKLASANRISEAFKNALKNSMGGDISSIANQATEFLSVFSEGVVQGDNFQFIYLPSTGTRVLKNLNTSADIPGKDFKQALFGMWLSDHSISDKLRKQLLGL